jgi:hypothetical protein
MAFLRWSETSELHYQDSLPTTPLDSLIRFPASPTAVEQEPLFYTVVLY